MPTDLVLYCKSYRDDLLRVRVLAESISKFNVDRLPFYLSVPEKDLPQFRDQLAGLPVEIFSDDDIVKSNPRIELEKVAALPGGLSQQIVKSEFWRLNAAESYLCIDSDCQFIRPFRVSDFISPSGTPYTVMHEAKEVLQFAVNNGMTKLFDAFHSEHQKLMEIFARNGRPFDFGPPPMIWSRHVWKALDEKFLVPKGMNFYDAIVLFPAEIQWYGESLLKYSPIPLIPVEPLFKFYHYEYQFELGQKCGDTVDRLAMNYLGVCYQSNWNRALNTSNKSKSLPSRLWSAIRKKYLGRRT